MASCFVVASRGASLFFVVACWVLLHLCRAGPAATERAGTFSALPTTGEDRIFNGSQARYVVSVEAAGARCVQVADFDQDGLPDIVAASSNDNTIAWYRQLQGGEFSPKQTVSHSSNGARIVAVGDIDQDNLTDIVVASYYDHTVAWFRNLGGRFGHKQVITESAVAAQGVFLVDIDNDGDLDVLSASSGDNTIAWYENLGDRGRFCEVRKLVDTNSKGVRTVIAVDLNKDGLTDLAAASKDDNTIAVYRNMGDGTFKKTVLDNKAVGAYSLVAEDVDMDGDMDLITAANMEGAEEDELHEGGKVSIYRNDLLFNTSEFPSFTKVAVTKDDDLDFFVLSVWAGDLDSDGDIDIASASFGILHTGGISWYENVDGEGEQWVRHRIYEPTISHAGHYVVGADIDGDGDTDLVATTHSDNKVQILYASSSCDGGAGSGFPTSKACCREGQIWNGTHCVRCPLGTYVQNETCQACPVSCPTELGHRGFLSVPPACRTLLQCQDIRDAYTRCDCQKDSFLDPHTSSCVACPEGYIFPRSGSLRTSSDYSLNEQTMLDGSIVLRSDLSWEGFNSEVSCKVPTCSPGSYFDSVERDCGECPGGQFSVGGPVTACSICPPGHACGQGTSRPTPCVPGYFAPEGSEDCMPSQLGHIVPLAKMSMQVPCQPGYSASEEAMSRCDPCAIGNYSTQERATACTSCGAGKATPRLWTTMQPLQIGDQLELAFVQKSESESDCGCLPGNRLEDGECVQCGEGLICKGMRETRIAPGYYSPSEKISVFQCRSSDECPGGPPGQLCRAGHHGLLCAECDSGHTLDLQGLCQECGKVDVAWTTSALMFIVVTLVAIYVMSFRYQRIAESQVVVFAGLILSQGVTVAQQLSIAGSMKLQLNDNHLQTVFGLLELMTFDIRVLRMGCIMKMSVVGHYVLSANLSLFFLTICTMIHLFVKCILHRVCADLQGGFGLRGAFGTVCFIMYITMLSLCISPFKCSEHPNGEWTMRQYPSVVCWRGGQHMELLFIGCLSILLPLAFLALTVSAVISIPAKMTEADTVFLDTHGYLFSRFRPQAYSYVLVIMARNTVLAVAVAIPDVFAQILILSITQLLALMAVIHRQPWRMGIANVLDVIFSAVMIVVIHLASFFAEGVDLQAVSWLLVLLIVGALSAVPLLWGCTMLFYLLFSYRKPYQFFLTHHKAKAGAFVRLLKIWLLKHPRVRKDIFLDVDNLTDLNLLFDHVRDETESVIIICTPGIHLRPWCVGELVVARMHSVPTYPVHMVGYEPPDEACIRNYSSSLVETSHLPENGISLDLIMFTLRWFVELPGFRAPHRPSRANIELLVNKLVLGDVEMLNHEDSTSQPRSPSPMTPSAFQKHQKRSSDSSGVAKVYIACNDLDVEAISGALILQHFLLPHIFHEAHGGGAGLLRAQDSLPPHLHKLLLFCTSDCLNYALMIDRAGLVLKKKEQEPFESIEVIPILGDETFEHPGKVGTSEKGWWDNLSEFQRFIVQTVFQEIAVPFFVKSSHTQLLQAQLKVILMRILKKKSQGNRISVVPGTTDTPKGGLEMIVVDNEILYRL